MNGSNLGRFVSCFSWKTWRRGKGEFIDSFDPIDFSILSFGGNVVSSSSYYSLLCRFRTSDFSRVFSTLFSTILLIRLLFL